jgi:hypothetical protein
MFVATALVSLMLLGISLCPTPVITRYDGLQEEYGRLVYGDDSGEKDIEVAA